MCCNATPGEGQGNKEGMLVVTEELSEEQQKVKAKAEARAATMSAHQQKPLQAHTDNAVVKTSISHYLKYCGGKMNNLIATGATAQQAMSRAHEDYVKTKQSNKSGVQSSSTDNRDKK